MGILTLSVKVFLLCGSVTQAAEFIEKLPIYGVIKPQAITTLLAVNNGMVSKMPVVVGDSVKYGASVLSVIEKETTRSYRTTLAGKVAKLHVTVGAAVTPGMPLVTILDPGQKKVEVSLSPQEAQNLKIGADVFWRGKPDKFGVLVKKSPLVDPDSGAVVSEIRPSGEVTQLIGDVIPLDIVVRRIENCIKVVPLHQLDKFVNEFEVEAASGSEACLKSLQR